MLKKVLTQDGLVLRNFRNNDDSSQDCVPPSTPNADYEFSNNFYKFPQVLPDISELIVPYVREIGVKACIDTLGNFFQCKEYKFNLLQFWFLDIITASLWATQDDFQFPDDVQKIILAWILYFINLIRDRSKNITRKQFFETFKEAILIASEVVEEGCDLVPIPDKLIILLKQEVEERSVSWKPSSTEFSNSSLEINQEDFEPTNLIELGDNENRRKYILPETKWRYQNHDLSSAAFSSTSNELEEYELKKHMKRRLKDVEFYKPDLNMPARFVSLHEESEETSKEEESETCSMCKIEEGKLIAVEDEVLHVREVPEIFQTESIAESVSTLTETADLVSSPLSLTMPGEINRHSILENIQNKNIIKNLAIQKTREQRIADMGNPRKGFIPSDIQITADVVQEESNYGEEEEEFIVSEESEESVDDEWIDAVINQQNQKTMANEDRQIMNYAVLRAIIDIIIKYFYESFQFTLIKMAFQATPEVICQKINEEWKMPKRNMLGFVRPKEQKPPKAPKVNKKEKADKKKDKGAKGTKEKSSKDKKDKKKEKPKQLTKEEKAELARLQKEREKLEEETRKIEENKRFMFPLTDAATDDLFMNIFDNWAKVDLTKKSQKGKGKAKK